MRLLLDTGASVQSADRRGTTALMMASHSGNASLVRLLLSRGADINRSTPQGATALTYAAGHKSIVALLLPHAIAPSKSPGFPVPTASPPDTPLEPLVPRLTPRLNPAPASPALPPFEIKPKGALQSQASP